MGDWAIGRVGVVLVLVLVLVGDVGFSEPSALEGSRFAGWRIWCFAATERLPGRQAAPEKRLSARQSYLICGMAEVVDRPIEQNTP